MKSFYTLLEESYQKLKKEKVKDTKNVLSAKYKVYKVDKKSHNKTLEKTFNSSLDATNFANDKNFNSENHYYAVEKESKYHEQI